MSNDTLNPITSKIGNDDKYATNFDRIFRSGNKQPSNICCKVAASTAVCSRGTKGCEERHPEDVKGNP